MSTKFFIGDDLQDFKTAPKFAPISKVELIVSDEVIYTAGDDTGRTMSTVCPWGTQQMADDILATFKGFRYQPYYADQMPLNPAAEIGDALNVSGIYGGLYGVDLDFKGLYAVNASAPEDEELDHEYQFEKKQDRVYKRELKNISSTLLVQADLISAKVEKVGGDPKSFYWKLVEDSWEVGSNGHPVFQVLDGKTITHGDIYADGGQIAGLKITPNSLTWNGQEIGMKIDLGKGGELKAPHGHFGGSTHAGGILHGGEYGNVSGSALKLQSVGGNRIGLNTLTGGAGGNLALSTISTSNTIKAINESLAKADTANAVLFGSTHCTNVLADGTLSGNTVNASSTFQFKGHTCSWGTVNGVNVITYG